MADYFPDKNYYQNQIKEQEKLKKDLSKVSYDSAKRGYVIDGKLYTAAQIKAQVNSIDSKISSLKADEKKYGKYGPQFGDQAKSNAAGIQYEKLYNTAVNIKVTNYASAVENLVAWKKVQDFVAANPDIKVAKGVSVIVDAGGGKRVRRYMNAVVPVDDAVDISAAVGLATQWAESDTTKTERVQTYGRKGGANAVYSDVKTVLDQSTLDARLKEIDATASGKAVSPEVQTAARKPAVVPTTSTTIPKSKAVSTDPKTGLPIDKDGNVVPVVVPPDATLPPKKGVTGPTGPVSTTTTVPVSPTTTVPTGPTGPTGPTVAKGATGPTVGKGATGPTVSKGSPAAPVVSVTPATGKGGKTPAAATVVVDGKKVKVGGEKWKEIIQEEFGSLWDIYNDNADVKKVIDKSVAEGWYNDTTKLNATLQNTNWYRATQSTVRQYTINKSADPATLEATIGQSVAELRAKTLASGVTLSDTTLRTLAENKLKFGWSEQQTANAIGSETVATARLGGPQAVADLRKGSVGTGLRAIADNYAQKPTDTMLDMWVAEVMQGTKTQEQFTDLMKTQASTQYRSLAPLIEKGQDVKTAVSMYTNAAQNVLGVDPNTVDWSQDKWNKALNYQDPKTNEYRQMD